MRKHGGTPSRRDKHVTLAAISPPGVARGRFVGGQQSGLAGSKPPPLFTREASSCSSQGRRHGEPWGASPRPSAPTYLPTYPTCANSLLYVDFIHGLPRFGGYDSCLVVTCGLSRFTRVFPCNKKITGEQTVKMLIEQWFEPYGAPKQVHSDEDVRIRSDTGWYKRVLNALIVEVTTGVPYTHTSNPLCERQNHVVGRI